MIANPTAANIDVLLERWAYWRLNGNGYPRQAAIANIGLSSGDGGFGSKPPKDVEPSADVFLIGQAIELLLSMGGKQGQCFDCLQDKLLRRSSIEQLAAERGISETLFRERVRTARTLIQTVIYWESSRDEVLTSSAGWRI